MEQAYAPPKPRNRAGADTVHPLQKVAVDTYRREEFQHLSPVQVIHKLMSLAVQGCMKKDKRQAVRAVNALILALDFKYRETAMGFFRLYDYCKICIYEGRFENAITILDGLKSTWAEAFHLKEAA